MKLISMKKYVDNDDEEEKKETESLAENTIDNNS